MALGSLPPWLTPPNFLGAMQAGAAAGLGARREDMAQEEAADRLKLAYDSLAQKEQMESERAGQRLELGKLNLALRAQQTDLLNRYRLGMMEGRQERGKALDLWRQQRMAEQEKALGLRTDLAERGLDIREASQAFREAQAEAKTSKPAVRTLSGEIVEQQSDGTWKAVYPPEPPPAGPGFLKQAWRSVFGGPSATTPAAPAQPPPAKAALAPPTAPMPTSGMLGTSIPLRAELPRTRPTKEARVRVRAPDGKRGTIPASQLEAAKAEGYEEE